MNPIRAYKETNIKTANQGKLIVMTYDGALRALSAAADLLDKKSRELDKVNTNIIKAQSLITELMVSLDFERGGDIAQSLYSLYLYFNRQLMDANIDKDPEPIKEIITHMSELRDAWSAIASKVGGESGNATGGVNIAG